MKNRPKSCSPNLIWSWLLLWVKKQGRNSGIKWSFWIQKWSSWSPENHYCHHTVASTMTLHGLNIVINSYRFSGLGPVIFQSSISKADDSDIQIPMVWTTMWALMGSGFHSRCLKGVSRLNWVPRSIPWASFWLSILGIRKYAQRSGDCYTQLQLRSGSLKVFSCRIPTDFNLNQESMTGQDSPFLLLWNMGKKVERMWWWRLQNAFLLFLSLKLMRGLQTGVRADLWQLCFPKKT